MKTVLGFVLVAGFVFVVLAVSLHRNDGASSVPASVAAMAIRPATPLPAAKKAPQPSPAQIAAAARNARKSWAQQVDSKLLDTGIESTTRTTGPSNTILVIECVLAGRVMAHQISQTDFPAAAKALGFKTLVLTNGLDDDLAETFRWDLTK